MVMKSMNSIWVSQIHWLWVILIWIWWNLKFKHDNSCLDVMVMWYVNIVHLWIHMFAYKIVGIMWRTFIAFFVLKLLWKEHYLEYVIFFFVDNVFTSKQVFHENFKSMGTFGIGTLLSKWNGVCNLICFINTLEVRWGKKSAKSWLKIEMWQMGMVV